MSVRLNRLTQPEIYMIVNDYIGVSSGYLGDFSYRTHREFYSSYCDLNINLEDYQGTTREKFIHILKASQPAVQARIVGGILEKYQVGSSNLRTQGKYEGILKIISRLEAMPPIENPNLAITSELVGRAIADAEQLIRENGATSGVDRIHTALHGYLKAVCDAQEIGYGDDPSLPELFKLLKAKHPALQNMGPRANEMVTIIRAFSSIIDALGPIRNRASVVHPNAVLLEQDEAMLVINTAKTLLHYLNTKFTLDPHI
jgi:Abortive infection C-terminus